MSNANDIKINYNINEFFFFSRLLKRYFISTEIIFPTTLLIKFRFTLLDILFTEIFID